MKQIIGEHEGGVRQGVDLVFWIAALMGLGLVAIFNYSSQALASLWAVAWLAVLIWVFASKITRSLGLLLLASCYERPVLDFGLGIRGTIKLVDLIIVALLVAALIRALTGKYSGAARRWDTLIWAFFAIVIMSMISASIVAIASPNAPVNAKFSIYYAIVIAEYFLAFTVLIRVPFSEEEVRKSLNVFLAGLVVVAVIGILQGLGVLATHYYTSETVTARIMEVWAISTLAPNHTHFGTFMALAVVLGMLGIHEQFKFRYFAAIVVCLIGLGFSHSAVGMGMLIIYFVILILSGDQRIRRLSLAPLMIIVLIGSIYVAGDFGESASRTAQRLDVVGSDSAILSRAIIRPFQLLGYASEANPFGLIVGHGFRVPKWGFPNFPESGDNNYFAITMDLGLLGLAVFMIFIGALLRRSLRARKTATSAFSQKLAHHGLLWLVVVLVGMSTQEILWPAHSRGSSMLIFLVFIALSARNQSLGLVNSGNRVSKAHATNASDRQSVLIRRQQPASLTDKRPNKGNYHD